MTSFYNTECTKKYLHPLGNTGCQNSCQVGWNRLCSFQCNWRKTREMQPSSVGTAANGRDGVLMPPENTATVQMGTASRAGARTSKESWTRTLEPFCRDLCGDPALLWGGWGSPACTAARLLQSGALTSKVPGSQSVEWPGCCEHVSVRKCMFSPEFCTLLLLRAVKFLTKLNWMWLLSD